MASRTLVLRRNGALRGGAEAGRLLDRLVAQPGVESVRIEALPLRVTLRVVAELADEAELSAIVKAQPLDRADHAQAPTRPLDPPWLGGSGLLPTLALGRSGAPA